MDTLEGDHKYIPMIDAILSVSDLDHVSVDKIRNAIQSFYVVDLLANKKQIGKLILERYYKLIEERETTEPQEQDEALKALEDERMAAKLYLTLNKHLIGLKKVVVPKLVRLHKFSEAEKRKIERRKLAQEARIKKNIELKQQKKQEEEMRKKAYWDKIDAERKAIRREKFLRYLPFYRLSPELEAIVGAKSLRRPQVLKKIWEYIKKNNVPMNGSFIVCDEKLEAVFGKTIHSFKMQKKLSEHLFWDRAPSDAPKTSDSSENPQTTTQNDAQSGNLANAHAPDEAYEIISDLEDSGEEREISKDSEKN